MPQVLKVHPDSPAKAATAVLVDVSRPAADRLRLRYLLQGALDRLSVPSRTTSTRTDELWRHTCLEAFVRGPAGEAYVEINLSPSTEWAAYAFAGYREGMTPLPAPSAPRIDVAVSPDALELAVELSLRDVEGLPPSAPWRLGLSAVIEETDGTLSYWALRHPPGRPDFHHPDCFALELPAPEGP